MARVYLIGLPGSGKSTASKQVAKNLHYKLVDLDTYIEKKEKMTISKIFQKYGEEYFRQKESEALAFFKDTPNLVISCGGGIILKKANKELMEGLVIFLNPPLEDIKLRLKRNDTTRPLLKTNSIETLYSQRIEKYNEFKDVEINETILSNVVSLILKEVAFYEKKDINN